MSEREDRTYLVELSETELLNLRRQQEALAHALANLIEETKLNMSAGLRSDEERDSYRAQADAMSGYLDRTKRSLARLRAAKTKQEGGER